MNDVPEASPDPLLLNVTEDGVEMAVYANAEPFQFKYVPAVVGAVINDVVAKAVLYGIWFAPPPATFVAAVAVEALPDKAAVIVPAEKLPEASRATTLEAVLADVASTANVRAAEPSNVPALVRYEPAVRALATEPAEPAILPETAEPLIAILVFVTLVIWPWALTANTGTAEAEP